LQPLPPALSRAPKRAVTAATRLVSDLRASLTLLSRKTLSASRLLALFRALSSAGSNLAVQTSREVRPSRFALPPTSIVYWLRLGFGVLAGVVYNIVGFGQGGVILGTLALISVGIGIYAVSVILVKNILGYGPDELKGPNKHVT